MPVITYRQALNDTLGVALEVNDRPAAVFVSTAPDVDVREALAVLRRLPELAPVMSA